MFGGGYPCSLPSCPQTMMCPYDVPVCQPYPCPVPVPQPYMQNIYQPVDVPIQHTIQPVIVPRPYGVPVPQPIPVPVDRPYAVPVPQPVPFPVEQAYAVPVPVCVPVPQPCAVPQPYVVRQQVCVPFPVPVPMPVQGPAPYQCGMQQQYYDNPRYDEEEYLVEEPIYVKRCRRRHRRRHRSCTPMAGPLPPIIIPIAIPGPPMVSEQRSLQITEYVQDIYPPAQVYTDQVPIGYVSSNSVVQQPGQMQSQHSTHCQPGVILPPSSCQQGQQYIVQQLPNGQMVQRPLSIGGHAGVQTVMSQPNLFSQSNSGGHINSCPSGVQFMS